MMQDDSLSAIKDWCYTPSLLRLFTLDLLVHALYPESLYKAQTCDLHCFELILALLWSDHLAVMLHYVF